MWVRIGIVARRFLRHSHGGGNPRRTPATTAPIQWEGLRRRGPLEWVNALANDHRYLRFMVSTTYKSHGVPLECYELTRRDHRDQRTSEDIAEAVSRMAQQWRAEEEADPELRIRRLAGVRKVYEEFLSVPVPDCDLMRWRVRLYCGHITVTRRHHTIEDPKLHGSSSMKCPECGKNPSHIVAYEPLGFVDQRPVPPPAPRRPTRAQLERRIAELEAELEA
jgi:hypothetical protein